MIKRLLPFLFSFFVFTPIFGQVYEPGLLVKSTGDTLRGEIENGFWVEPPAFIRFRPAPNSPSQLFQPRQLQAVSFAGGRYFRYEALPLDHAAQTQLDRLPHTLTPDVQVDSLLAEVLVDGPATLLRVVPGSVVHYFIRRPDRPMLDLSERKYLRQNDNGTADVADANNYLGLLGFFFSDCPAASKIARNAPFTADALAETVQAYNQGCSPAHQPGLNLLSQAAPRRLVALRGGLLAGARYNRLATLISANSPTPDAGCSDCQAQPYVGLYADLFRPSRTSALYGELSVSTFRVQHSVAAYAASNLVPDYRFATKRGLLGTARLDVRFFFPLPRERQWLLGVGYELNSTLGQTVVTATGPDGPLRREELYYAAPTLLPNLAVGWRSQRLTLSADGQFYQDENKDISTSYLSAFFGPNFALRLGVAYRLGGNPDEAKAR